MSDTAIGTVFPSTSWRSAIIDCGSRAAILMVTAVGAWIFGHWFWRMSPKSVVLPVPSVTVQPLTSARELAAQHRFGAQASPATVVADSGGVVLLGVVAARSGKGGLAIFQVDGKKQITAVAGKEVVPGLVLSRVASDHVVLSRDGQLTTVPLSRRK